MGYDLILLFAGTSGAYFLLILVWFPLSAFYDLKSYNRTLIDLVSDTGLFTLTLERAVVFAAAFGIAYYIVNGNLMALLGILLLGIHCAIEATLHDVTYMFFQNISGCNHPLS